MKVSVEGRDLSYPARLAAHSAVSTSLALRSDRELRDLVDAASPLGTGIGGTSALMEVGGTAVFVKRVPLTDLEEQAENVRSTANLYGLPAFWHYGIGWPGFGGVAAGRNGSGLILTRSGARLAITPPDSNSASPDAAFKCPATRYETFSSSKNLMPIGRSADGTHELKTTHMPPPAECQQPQ